MEYSSRLGDRPEQAHVNYKCPCGCVAGLLYDRNDGPEQLGACCCGRLLWVGAQATAVVRSHLEASIEYVIDQGSVSLPWGEVAPTALAVPESELSH